MDTTTVTQKGQVTLPKHLRDLFGIREYDKVSFEVGNGYIKVKPAQDILDLAGTFNPSAKKPLLKARKIFEKRYKRF